MKIMGFAIIVLGLVMIYVGITGSQHSIMAIIKNGPASQGGQKINPSGTGTSGNGSSPSGNQTPGPGSVTIV